MTGSSLSSASESSPRGRLPCRPLPRRTRSSSTSSPSSCSFSSSISSSDIEVIVASEGVLVIEEVLLFFEVTVVAVFLAICRLLRSHRRLPRACRLPRSGLRRLPREVTFLFEAVVAIFTIAVFARSRHRPLRLPRGRASRTAGRPAKLPSSRTSIMTSKSSSSSSSAIAAAIGVNAKTVQHCRR